MNVAMPLMIPRRAKTATLLAICFMLLLTIYINIRLVSQPRPGVALKQLLTNLSYNTSSNDVHTTIVTSSVAPIILSRRRSSDPRHQAAMLRNSSSNALNRMENKTETNVTFLQFTVENSGDVFFIFRNVIDIPEVKLIINNNVCSRDVFTLLLVHSGGGKNYAARRSTIRQTWGSVRDIGSRHLALIFILGYSGPILQQKIAEENDKHHDIVQGEFTDHYRNLSYKHVLGLRWASHFCSHANYVIKLDDDVFLEPYNAVRFLEGWTKKSTDKNVIPCRLWNSPPHRHPKNKWYVTKQEFNETNYPAYCLGPLIIYTPDIAKRIGDLAAKSSYFWIDDVWVSGILRERLNISIHDLKSSETSFFGTSERSAVSSWLTSKDETPFPKIAALLSKNVLMNQMWKKTITARRLIPNL